MVSERFDDKVALVVGASSGIGRAAAAAFVRAGARVVVVGRRRRLLEELVSSAEGEGGGARVKPVVADVRSEEERRRIVKETVSFGGGLDVLVLSAGIISYGTVEDTTLDAWREMFDTNVEPVFRLIQMALPHLIPRKGNVVVVSSICGLRSFAGLLAYCAAKASIDQLTRCAALELAPKGVRVNAVNPGLVVTNLQRAAGMSDEDYQALLGRSESTHPLGRVGTPEEVADLILYLASDRAGWITGATVPIDGGRILTCAR